MMFFASFNHVHKGNFNICVEFLASLIQSDTCDIGIGIGPRGNSITITCGISHCYNDTYLQWWSQFCN